MIISIENKKDIEVSFIRVTIGEYTYYFDDSAGVYISRWKVGTKGNDEECEVLTGDTFIED